MGLPIGIAVAGSLLCTCAVCCVLPVSVVGGRAPRRLATPLKRAPHAHYHYTIMVHGDGECGKCFDESVGQGSSRHSTGDTCVTRLRRDGGV